jgi:gamma-glutamylcyclotransferase (GGCT)/AIG2-like uncharacterized protein YtfP|tara:strand:- start:2641 stop:3012 length:372 start_codon:yes stop_codon:yes gene_type:complete
MKNSKLAVYGTLRNGKRDTWKVDGYSLVFPGHRDFPAALPDRKQKGMIVEVFDVDDIDMVSYDRYEGVDSNLYHRKIVSAYKGEEEVEAWMYIIGSSLLQYCQLFELVPNKDWMSKQCLKLRT